MQTEVLQLQKSPPLGEGVSYRVSAENSDGPGTKAQSVNPYVRYNGRYGIYTAEYRGRFEKDRATNENYQVAAMGSIVYAGDTFGFSRPVDDSFAIVEVVKTPGVMAYYNNQEIGRTDARGKVVVPNLGSYMENYLAINDKDVPVNFNLTSVNRYVSPPLRSGTHLKFEATKTQAFTGFFKLKIGDTVKPLEFYEITVKVPGNEFKCPTGRDGEFYLENIPAGAYPVEFMYEQQPRRFLVHIPESEEIIVDLGEIHVPLEGPHN